MSVLSTEPEVLPRRRASLFAMLGAPPLEEGLRSWLIWATFVYLGFDGTWPKITVAFEPVSLALGTAMVLAVVGWLSPGLRLGEIRSYFPWAIFFGAWVSISAVAAWGTPALENGLPEVAWFVFLVPGLALLLRDVRNRDGLLLGLASGTCIFLVTATFRLLTGREVLDEVDGPGAFILDVIRNAVNLRIIIVAAFLLAPIGPPIVRRLRWPVLAMAVVTLLNSGGRGGLLGVAALAAMYGIVQPGASRRVRMVLVVALCGAIAFLWITSQTGTVHTSTERLSNLLRGERTDADEAREILLRKAWHLAAENPLYGVGFGNFRSVDHPVIQESRTVRIRSLAQELGEHNTYAAVMSTTGFPGLILFVGLLSALMWMGSKKLRDPWVRAALIAIAGYAFSILFQGALSVLTYFPIVLLLGSVLGADRDGDPVARGPN